MYNVRYHIASLVAIFLSLSIGLLLGTIVAERGTLDAQRDALISGLRNDFEELSSENAVLSGENERRDGYVTATLPLLVAGQLDGRSVFLLRNTGRSDGVSDVEAAILSAGGTPVMVTLNGPDLGLDDPDVSQVASATIGAFEGDLADAVVMTLAEEWSLPLAVRPLTAALVDAGSMQVEGLDDTRKADGVVVMASWDDVPDASAMSIARALADGGSQAVGVETLSQRTGVAEEAANRGLSAVDDIKMPEGVYSLVYVLAGRASGFFGVGPAATAPYPVVAPE